MDVDRILHGWTLEELIIQSDLDDLVNGYENLIKLEILEGIIA